MLLLGICGILIENYYASASVSYPAAAHTALRRPSLSMMFSALCFGGDDARMVPVGKGASAGMGEPAEPAEGAWEADASDDEAEPISAEAAWAAAVAKLEVEVRAAAAPKVLAVNDAHTKDGKGKRGKARGAGDLVAIAKDGVDMVTAEVNAVCPSDGR